jgi:Subtilase family
VLWASEEAASKGVATLLQRYQLRPRQRFNLGQLGLTVVMLALPTSADALVLRDKLRSEQVDWIVDLNARSVSMQGVAVSDETSVRLYAQKMLGVPTPAAPTVTPVPLSSNAFRLGVIDTAIDPALLHADALNGTVITQRSVLGPADVPAAPTHGSTVLLLLAAKPRANGFAGAAPALQLAWVSAMRLQGDKPSTNSLLLSVALDWLVGKQVALINMSLGGQGDAVLQAVIARVLAKHVAIVAAVGNNPASDAPPMYPAAYEGVWAVTAVDASAKRYSQANRAVNVAWAAPGVELWVPYSGAKDGANSSYVSGTSFATALASAALAWQTTPFWGLTGIEKKAKLCMGAIKAQNDPLLGCGVLQAASQLRK